MTLSAPLEALNAETDRLSAILAGLAPRAWSRPTRCAPWDVSALCAHLTIGLSRLVPMLDAPAPPAATVDAAGYFRPDARYSEAVNTTRLDDALGAAAGAGGPALAATFDLIRRNVLAGCGHQPPGRLVTTRHGDPMTLADFLTTRVVEVAVHGIDLADALDRPRWTTPEASAHVSELLLGPGVEAALAGLGWDPVAFIAKATGRDPLPAAERARAEALGVRWLALG
ncbi:maleylpyruvate isomerase N-terminal domain-containing protein [Glycomyces sp. NRRL B-16210]|uniref:maleylpyruvate isomerase N-terminal domain-containing protein n=1 Tax=Glycomyces sp. NRRL B-16210 TaxID=1463821 RepID=UPI0004BF70B3|nr:maleylpyruvate isomerase N-terminal domain-containing protein [Glycomyces sp. NRRL B-16210]